MLKLNVLILIAIIYYCAVTAKIIIVAYRNENQIALILSIISIIIYLVDVSILFYSINCGDNDDRIMKIGKIILVIAASILGLAIYLV
jgi:hypothetical protein